MIYAGIGSRQTPYWVLKEMVKTAKDLAERGFVLRSGRAGGADQAFEYGVLLATNSPELIQIYMPSNYFCKKLADGKIYHDTQKMMMDKNLYDIALDIAKSLHPRPEVLKNYIAHIMVRNVVQALGPDLDKPADFILCWTEGAKLKGGTAMVLRIAVKYNIPVFNFGVYRDYKDFESRKYELENFIQNL